MVVRVVVDDDDDDDDEARLLEVQNRFEGERPSLNSGSKIRKQDEQSRAK
jgi:hypothetical protein